MYLETDPGENSRTGGLVVWPGERVSPGLFSCFTYTEFSFSHFRLNRLRTNHLSFAP